MKTLLTALLILGLASIVFAGSVYEKEDNYTLKVTTTTSSEDIKTYTRPELATERARKLDEITSNYNSYLARDTALRADLADIDTRIQEAVNLGIKESAEVVEP